MDPNQQQQLHHSAKIRENGGQEPVAAGLRLIELRPFRPFKSSEEYLWAMKEDLAEWLRTLYGSEATLDIGPDNFCDALDTGVLLCHHANNVRRMALEYERQGRNGLAFRVPPEVSCRPEVSTNAFHARDNVSNFISFCRALRIKDCLLFETDDLVLKKNEKSVILCLLEVARRGSKVGMLAPLLVQMEEEIDREIADDENGGALLQQQQQQSVVSSAIYVDCGPKQQVINNDLKSLDEMVRDLVNRCTCPTQFYMERISEGKYRIGESKLTIYVRILRSHVMVRVGGGWDTLAHYLDKHDPCRCRQGHRAAVGSKLTVKFGPSQTQMEVSYLRSPVAPASHPSPFLPGSRQQQQQQQQQRSISPNPSVSPPRQRRASTSSTSSSSHKLSTGSLASDNSAATTPSPRNSTLLNPQQQQQHGDAPACRLSYGGDSGSEQSDEGYRGASPHHPPPKMTAATDHDDGPTTTRPKPSALLLTNGDRRRRSSGEAPHQMTNGHQQVTNGGMQRSRSNDGGERPLLELRRNVPSRYSYRTSRAPEGTTSSSNNSTWSFRERTTRPPLGPDTFVVVVGGGGGGGGGGGRRMASPSSRGRSSSFYGGGGLRSLQTSPSKEVLTIQEIINSDLESSEKVDRIQSILNCGATTTTTTTTTAARRGRTKPSTTTNGHRRRSSTPPSPDSGSDMGCDAAALPPMRCLKISPRKDNHPNRESKIPVPKYEALYSLQPLC